MSPRKSACHSVKSQNKLTPRIAEEAKCRPSWQKRPGLTASRKQRVFVSHDYQDLATEVPYKADIDWVQFYKNKPLKSIPFALKLHCALERVEEDGLSNVFGWLGHGRAFKIHDREVFKSKILTQYIGMTNYASFLRQCSLYCFRRLTRASGVASYGAMYNEYFLRGKPFLLQRMKRIKVKGTEIRAAANFEEEPNFFEMTICNNDSDLMQQYEDSRTVAAQLAPPVDDVSCPSVCFHNTYSQLRFEGLIFYPIRGDIDNDDDVKPQATQAMQHNVQTEGALFKTKADVMPTVHERCMSPVEIQTLERSLSLDLFNMDNELPLLFDYNDEMLTDIYLHLEEV